MALCIFVLVLAGASTWQQVASTSSLPQAATSQEVAPLQSIGAAWARLGPANASHVPLVAVLASKAIVQSHFRHVCGAPGAASTRPSAGLPEACWRLLEQRACRHVFTSSIIGVAGRFTRQQLGDLQECAGGPGGIAYLASDSQVRKAEGSSHDRWWTYRPPTGLSLQQLQQLAASKLGAATAAGVASGIQHPDTLPVTAADGQAQGSPAAAANSTDGSAPLNNNSSSCNSSMPQDAALPGKRLPASGSNTTRTAAASGSNMSAVSNVTLALIQRWILAEVGLAAQQQLAQPNMQQQQQQQQQQPAAAQVTAADGATQADLGSNQPGGAAATYVVTADGTGADGDISVGQPRGSKNQDPGIVVDPKAVAQPDIIVRTSGDSGSSSNRSAAPQDLQQPLSLSAAEKANKAPGIKEQRLVTALWNLDRIDQRQLPLSSTFSYGSSTAPGTGKGVRIYVLDSGIRASHQEFQPWDASGPSRTTVGPDFVDNDGVANDCDGHGTHVSSTAAGRSVGVAKEAHVVAVRVLDCDGAGTISNVVAGLEWVAQNAVKPAVVSLSLGVPAGQWSQPLEDAIKHLTEVMGIAVVVAAGNSAKDSCGVAPARVPSAITVAASNIPTKFSRTQAGDNENLYSWSNTGACVKLFAPGVDIYGACGGASRCATLNDSSYTWASGTSMAAPHVTGAVAVYLESHPSASPSEVTAALAAAASTGHVSDAAMLPGTPNKLLYTGAAAAV